MALSFFFFSPIPLPAIPSPFLSLPLGVPILKSNLEVWGVQALQIWDKAQAEIKFDAFFLRTSDILMATVLMILRY